MANTAVSKEEKAVEATKAADNLRTNPLTGEQVVLPPPSGDAPNARQEFVDSRDRLHPVTPDVVAVAVKSLRNAASGIHFLQDSVDSNHPVRRRDLDALKTIIDEVVNHLSGIVV